MANRIQLRRDTQANWNRVNPILEDGEPGLDITQNKIKYGDGSSTWTELAYASGESTGSSGNTLVNGEYVVSLGADGELSTPGNVRLAPGGRFINDGSIGSTASHWINYPDSTTNWFIRIYEDEGANLKARLGLENLSDVTIETTGNIAGMGGDGPDYKWTFGGDGKITLPENGLIQTVGNTASATLQWLPTAGNLSTSTSVYVSATGVRIETDASNNENTWVFDTNGVINLPNIGKIGAIETSSSVDLYGDANVQYVQLNWNTENFVYVDSVGAHLQAGPSGQGPGQYEVVLTTDGNLSIPGNVTIGSGYGNISMIDTISANSYVYANGISILSGIGSSYGNAEVATYLASGSLETAWVHGNLTVGNLTVNGNITYIGTNSYVVTDNIVQFADGNPADTLDLGFVAHRTVGGTLEHTGLVRDASAGNWKLFSNITAQPGTTVDFANVIYDDLVVGNISSPTIDSLINNANVNIASYLPTYTGAITASNLRINRASPSVSTGGAGDLRGTITADTNYLYYAVDTYGNGTYSVILATSNNGSVFYHDIVKGDYPEPKAGWSMSVSGSILLVESVTDGGSYWRLNSNTSTTYSAGASANLTGNSGTVWKSIPLQSFQTSAYGNTQVSQYLTTNPQSGTYSNSNVASYLPTYSGNITATNITATGNVTANIFVSNTITGAVANANTTITAGSYTSTFDTAGNVALPGNVTVGGMGVIMPTRPAFRVNGSTQGIPQTLTANVNLKGAAITVAYNQGSYFDSTTGKFTAPIAGIYSVGLNARVGTLNAASQIAVLKNGNNTSGNIVCFWETDTNTGTAVHFGVNGTVVLAVGDYLSANILQGNITFDNNDNWHVTYLG